MKDPIVEEIHRRREERAARHGHDIDAMFDELRRREQESRSAGAKFAAPKRKPQRKSSKSKHTLSR